MYEKLLALLTTKFSQARKDGLQQLARSLAIQATDETESQALVDKIEVAQVTTFIKDWRKDVDSEISKGTKSFEDNLKSKYDLIEKKSPTKPIVKTDETPTDIAGIVAKAVADAITPLQKKIEGFETGITTENRKEVLIGKLKEAPEIFKNTVLKNFDKMSFDSQEDFDTFVTETEEAGKTMEQETANTGLGVFPTPNSSTSKQLGEAVSADIKEWATSKKKND